MPVLKIIGLVFLVVLPGGSLVLLAMAGYRAWKQRSPSQSWSDLKRNLSAPFSWLGRVMRHSFATAPNRA